MPELLNIGQERIPTLAGIKFSNPDLAMFQRCLRAGGGDYEIFWGIDECLLAALSLGGEAAVGSTYNLAAPVYHRMIAAFRRGDLAEARREQYRSVELVTLLGGYGFMGACKAVMKMLGVDVGPARPPINKLDSGQYDLLAAELRRCGFFDWAAPPS